MTRPNPSPSPSHAPRPVPNAAARPRAARPGRAALARRTAVAAAIVATGGCGSGSSGFDPQFAEQRAIVASASTLTCRPRAPGGLEVCAIGAPLTLPFEAPPDVGAAPAESPVAGLSSDVGGGEALSCAGPDGGVCTLRVLLRDEPFAPGTRLVAAIRPEGYDRPWRTSVRVLEPPADRVLVPSFATDLPVGTPILTAVLVYPPGTAAPSVEPDGLDADLLADLGAPRAGIVLGLTIPPPQPVAGGSARGATERAPPSER